MRHVLSHAYHSLTLYVACRRAYTGGPARTTRGSRGGTSASARPPRGPKKAKTAEELDKELDAFMGDGDVPEPAAAAAQDVDMV